MEHATLTSIVIRDFRAAAVFERHGLDFCCGGGATLAEACQQRGLDAGVIRAELERSLAGDDVARTRFESWDLDVLVEYIVSTHHTYVSGAIPVLLAHATKVASVHGSLHPEVIEIQRLFRSVAEEMTSHMQKEELMLFPHIRAIARSRREGGTFPRAPFGTLAAPIGMMESEHASAGGAMERIRELSERFTPPDDACTTFRVTYKELEQFERDLHVHVHLENNILFPRSLELESTLTAIPNGRIHS